MQQVAELLRNKTRPEPNGEGDYIKITLYKNKNPN